MWDGDRPAHGVFLSVDEWAMTSLLHFQWGKGVPSWTHPMQCPPKGSFLFSPPSLTLENWPRMEATTAGAAIFDTPSQFSRVWRGETRPVTTGPLFSFPPPSFLFPAIDAGEGERRDRPLSAVSMSINGFSVRIRIEDEKRAQDHVRSTKRFIPLLPNPTILGSLPSFLPFFFCLFPAG